MTTKKAIDEFLKQPALAVVGVSRGGKKFGSVAYRELKSKGYRVYPVHPQAATIDGDKAYPNLGALPEPVGGVLIVVPPTETEKVVRDIERAHIGRVWMQPGAQSEEAVRFCEVHGIEHVEGECILMHASPLGFAHRLHHWVWGALGRLPGEV